MKYKLKVEKLSVDDSDVIKTVYWYLTFYDLQDQNIGWEEGLVELDPADSNNFINFVDITESQLIAWTEAKLDIESYYQASLNRLEQEKNKKLQPNLDNIKMPPWLGGQVWTPNRQRARRS